jgi:hypothetical protein
MLNKLGAKGTEEGREGKAVSMHDMKAHTGSSIVIKFGAIWK